MGLQVGARICRIQSNGRYQIVLRWLADDPTNLPAPSDSFRVRVCLTTSTNSYLRSDGTFDPSGTPHDLMVSPRNFAMIDPPREEVPVEPAILGAVQALNSNDLRRSFVCTPLPSNRDRYYDGRILEFTSGVLQGKSYLVSDYLAGAHLLTLASEWSDLPSVGDQFLIEPIGSEAISITPTGPVNCSLDPGDPLPNGVGLGICNLLRNTQPFRIRELATLRLKDPIRAAIAATSASIGLNYRSTSNQDELCEKLAVNIAELLSNRSIRPKRFLSWLNEAHAELVVLTTRRTWQSTALVNDLFLLDSRENVIHQALLTDRDSVLGSAWEMLHILVGLVGQSEYPMLIDDLERLIYHSQQARRFLSLRALQGGSLVDFWCSPDVSTATCANDRGKEYPAASLVGLGLSIGQFTDSDLDVWIARNARMIVDVQHQTTSGHVHLGQGEARLHTTEIQNARNTGSSLPPTPPSRLRWPRINYDLLQSNVDDQNHILDGASSQSTHFRHVTGDGLVQILMRFESAASINAGGFNVYGMWEDTSTSQYFSNPHLQPSLDELRTWLITRRYSYSRDLVNSLPQIAIDRLNQFPPEEPVFFRPAGATDHGAVDNQTFRGAPLPVNVQNPDSLVFTFDLRRGMSFSSGWDPKGRIDSEWNPTLKRDRSSAGTKPQGYRFWVTSVDLFGQESEPVPVRTDDPASNLSEEYIYRPVYRTPLPPPSTPVIQYDADLLGLVCGPATSIELSGQETFSHVDGTYVGRSVEFVSGNLQSAGPRTVSAYDGSTRRLTFSSPWPLVPQERDSFVIRSPQVISVRWETPYLTPVGRRDSDPVARLPKSSLRANVQLFRRPTTAVAAPGNVSRSPSLPNVSQWDRILQTLRNEGWTPFRDLMTLNGTGSTPDWLVHYTGLQHADKGFSYLAAVSLEVIGPEKEFWASNITSVSTTPTQIETKCLIGEMHNGRCVQRIKSIPVTAMHGIFTVDEYQYELVWELASEYPTHSEVGRTEPVDAPNLEEPRGVESSILNQLHFATHVLPVGAILRDAVLTRLLTSQFYNENTPIDRDIYRDTGLRLTAGQTAMLDMAICRAGFAPDDARLEDARRLMAMEATSGGGDGSSNAPYYVQHSVIGFRGLLELSWTYTSAEMRPLTNTESEADGILIEQVRVPRYVENQTATSNITARGNFIRQLDDRHIVYELRPMSNDASNSIKDISAILRQLRSGAVRLDHSNGDSIIGVIVNATTNNAGEIDVCEIEVEFLEDITTPPTVTTAYVYFATELTNLRVNCSSVILPVGGGPAELICWTINTVSATGRRTSHSRRKHVAMYLHGTIAPPAPTLFSVLPPSDDHFHGLDRDMLEERQWLPQDLLQSSADLTSITPHLVVSWRPIEDPNVGVAIVRSDILVGSPSLRSTYCDLSVWEAVIAIEAQPENLPLQLQWLNLLVQGTADGSQRWLLGEPVCEPNQPAVEQRLIDFHGVNEIGFLSANTGIRLLPEPGSVFRVSDTPNVPTNTEFCAADTLLVDDLYDQREVEFCSGLLAGERRSLSQYMALDPHSGAPLRRLRFAAPWSNVPQVGDQFVIFYKAGFIDYSRLWNNRQLAMNVDYEYDYQICNYIDLAPQFRDTALNTMPATTRFLRSKLSTTHRGRPQTAPIQITVAQNPIEDTDQTLPAPVVIFRFTFENNEHLRSLTDVDGWRYRVLVRRVRFFSLPSDPSIISELGFEDIGSPLSVDPDDIGYVNIEIRDENLERPGFNLPFDVRYEILVSQFATIAGQQDRMIRSPQSSGLVPVRVTSCSNPDNQERVIIRLVNVR